jgi:acyl carrier protein
MLKVYENLITVLEDMGYLVFEKEDDDFEIGNYIVDSLNFIDFIVRIEEKLEIELSDDFLNYELIMSAKGFSNKIFTYIEENDYDLGFAV